MRNCKPMLCVLAFALVFAVDVPAADAPKLSFKFTTTDLPGELETFPEGVNNTGVSVGSYQDKNMLFHGYILRGKKVTTLDDPNGTFTGAIGINCSSSEALRPAWPPGPSYTFRFSSPESSWFQRLRL